MKKFKFFPVIMAVAILCSSCSASTGSITNLNNTNVSAYSTGVVDNSITVWSAPATEKVLQDKLTGYDAIKGAPKVEVYSAKGEYEGTQLILTSVKAVNNIDLVTSALTLEGASGVTFPVENVEVFFEKYLDVTKIFDDYWDPPTGKYPDALPPLENVIAVGENKMEANANQGLYIRFNVSTSQQAGVYTGTWKLKYNNAEKDIPVQLTVQNYTISQETHSRTMFLHDWYYGIGELDTTQEMFNKYVSAGLEYRISPGYVVADPSTDDEGIAYYVDTAVNFMKDPKCTHISLLLSHVQVDNYEFRDADGTPLTIYDAKGNQILPDADGGKKDDVVELSGPGIDGANLEKFLNKFIDRAFADKDTYGDQYIKKLGAHLVDEPGYNEQFDSQSFLRTQITTQVFKDTIRKVANDLKDRLVSAGEWEGNAFAQQIYNDILNIRAVISNPYADRYAPYVDTWCPTVDGYNSQTQRDQYASQEEKWWYTCVTPETPYPSYHIEDTLLSARLLSWMQSQYDVVGNLYWATTIYANYNGTNYEYIEDIYEGDANRFGNKVNGDGYLFYPGKPYGVDGPVGSLRLEAIRDGLEEYELFYDLKQKYAQIASDTSVSIDSSKVIENLTTELYAGTVVNTDTDKFNNARESLYSLVNLVSSNSKFTIADFYDNGSGLITYKVFVAEGFDVYSDGSSTPLAPSQIVSGKGKFYTITRDLNNNQTTLNLTISNGADEYSYYKNLGGNATTYQASEFENAFVDEYTSVTASMENTSLDGVSGNFLKLILEAAGKRDDTQRIRFNYADVFEFSADTKKVVLNLYFEGLDASGEDLKVNAKYLSGAADEQEPLSTVKVYNGWNVVEIYLNNFTQAIEYLTVGGFTSTKTVQKTMYLKDIIVYNK